MSNMGQLAPGPHRHRAANPASFSCKSHNCAAASPHRPPAPTLFSGLLLKRLKSASLSACTSLMVPNAAAATAAEDCCSSSPQSTLVCLTVFDGVTYS